MHTAEWTAHALRNADGFAPDAAPRDAILARWNCVTAALAGMAHVAFISSPHTVIVTRDGCAQVKDSGILITLGTVKGDGHEMRVAINGWVACLGATWLTYVVQNQPGTGWRVTGTTGSMAVS